MRLFGGLYHSNDAHGDFAPSRTEVFGDAETSPVMLTAPTHTSWTLDRQLPHADYTSDEFFPVHVGWDEPNFQTPDNSAGGSACGTPVSNDAQNESAYNILP